MFWRYEVTGVDTITLHFGEKIDVALVSTINRAASVLHNTLGERLLDAVPSYTTLLLRYDLLQDDLASLVADLKPALDSLSTAGNESAKPPEVVDVPVFYDPRVGPDLENIASRANISVEEAIKRHTGRTYHVFAIGFAPGFAYLGQVADELAAPRLSTPRKKVPAGTLGIADTQTAIYPISSPGGWNLIGRTPLTLFDPDRTRPSLLEAGQLVRFRAISESEYTALSGKLDDLPWETAAANAKGDQK
ncbi:5-oxoprolinase subunit PxpB [Marinobacter sp. BGYM27]|uniref:5-oxoprolinase subunit PxpB n=1 Tax=Marinobacter sp. BGYM27 TaxID=2975597 RepID=UPI0021A3A92D|nr:5-oxoprolinase subunit PxpB [Marinobacter sp. BGYM27]MDG5500596.1 5-oxoprolinase subunit PxpB [Marinobacter sp. BGYM27]